MDNFSGAQEDTGIPRSSDPRAARTRQVIFEAVQELVSQRTATVNVSDIVRTAGISRSSFYAHFTGLDELAVEFLRLQFDLMAPSDDLSGLDATGTEAARVGYRRLISHMLDHYPLYSSVLEVPLTRGAYDEVVGAYANRLLETVLVDTFAPTGIRSDVVATYVAGGAVTLISAWMRGLIDVSDDELVEQLISMLPPWLTEKENRGTIQ